MWYNEHMITNQETTNQLKYIAFIFAVILALLLFTTPSDAKTIRVAVIDTGFDFKSTWPNLGFAYNRSLGLSVPRLCKEGHKDFTDTSIQDVHGHGTHIAGLIAKYAKGSDYCLIILKYYHSTASSVNLTKMSIDAFRYAVSLKVDIINYSGGGIDPSFEEGVVIKDALDKGIVIVAAAGNNHTRIDYRVSGWKTTHYYDPTTRTNRYERRPILEHVTTKQIDTQEIISYFPATYDSRIVAVTNSEWDGSITYSSNYGLAFKDENKERGVNIPSLGLHNQITHMTGTSQSTAIRTGKIINKWKRNAKYGKNMVYNNKGIK
jgi:subtilisin family serine protease